MHSFNRTFFSIRFEISNCAVRNLSEHTSAQMKRALLLAIILVICLGIAAVQGKIHKCSVYDGSRCEGESSQSFEVQEIAKSHHDDKCYELNIPSNVTIGSIEVDHAVYSFYNTSSCDGKISSFTKFGVCNHITDSSVSVLCKKAQYTTRERGALVYGIITLLFCLPCAFITVFGFPFSVIFCGPCALCMVATILLLVLLADGY